MSKTINKTITPPARTGEIVTIACKLPHGLQMRVFEMFESQEPVMGGGFRAVQQSRQKGEAVIIHGNAVPFGQIPNYKIVGGYALTEGVSKDFWELFASQNSDQAFIQNKLVFATDTISMAEGQANEQSILKSGLQPISLDSKGQVNDPRAGKKIQTADENTNKPVAAA